MGGAACYVTRAVKASGVRGARRTLHAALSASATLPDSSLLTLVKSGGQQQINIKSGTSPPHHFQ